MSQVTWQLHHHTASLAVARFQATLQLRRPGDGLVDVKLAHTPLAESRFLGIAVPPAESTAVPMPTDCYVRGSEVVVGYEATAGWPVQIDAAWREMTSAATSDWIAAVELVVSVRTALLDSRPELSVCGAIAAEEQWRLVDPAGPRFEATGVSQSRSAWAWERGPSCLLFRLLQSGFSYVEMVHPADFCGDELTHVAGENPRLCACHRLFAAPLEKGVLLRGRVRGIFVPRTDDLAIAAAAYARFAAEEPLLESY